MGAPLKASELARYIDHTLLKAEAREEQIRTLCQEARQHNFYSVCVNSRWVALAARELKGSQTLAISVVGFPLGANLSAAKAAEATQAIAAGAGEIDMVLDVGAAKDGRWQEVENDIREVAKACGKIPLKVILEICYLSPQEIVAACKAAEKAGAAFVKTSTGFGSGGATVEAVVLMRQSVSSKVGVKASGGIRNNADALRMIEAGATRLGTSASVAIVSGGTGSGNY